MIRMIKLEERDIGSILKVYKNLEKGIPPNNRDVDNALEYMYDYYDEYLQWYDKYKKGVKSRLEMKVWKEFEIRYNEIENVMFDATAPLNQKVMALDNAINQLHIDYPVLAHLQMEVEDEEDEAQMKKFNMLIQTLETMLKRQGKELPRVGYGKYNTDAMPARY